MVNILIDPEKLFREAINMFKLKIGSNEDFRFIYNNKELLPDLKISQSGLNNGSKIFVIPFNNLYIHLNQYFILIILHQ